MVTCFFLDVLCDMETTWSNTMLWICPMLAGISQAKRFKGQILGFHQWMMVWNRDMIWEYLGHQWRGYHADMMRCVIWWLVLQTTRNWIFLYRHKKMMKMIFWNIQYIPDLNIPLISHSIGQTNMRCLSSQVEFTSLLGIYWWHLGFTNES